MILLPSKLVSPSTRLVFFCLTKGTQFLGYFDYILYIDVLWAKNERY